MIPTTRFTCTTNTSQMPIKCKKQVDLFSLHRRRRRLARRTPLLRYSGRSGRFLPMGIYCFTHNSISTQSTLLSNGLSLDIVNNSFLHWFLFFIIFCSDYIYTRNNTIRLRSVSVYRSRNMPTNRIYFILWSPQNFSMPITLATIILYSLHSIASKKKNKKIQKNLGDFGIYLEKSTYLVQNCRNNFFTWHFHLLFAESSYTQYIHMNTCKRTE